MIITKIRRLMRKSSKLCDGVQPARLTVSNVQGAVTACFGVLILLILGAHFGLFSVRFHGQPVEEILEQRIKHLETTCKNLDNGGRTLRALFWARLAVRLIAAIISAHLTVSVFVCR